jgi:hypothetical protein
MARKSKYTPEVVEHILEAIRMGATYELAAQYAGIGYSTFRDWMTSKVAFSEAVKEAEGKAVVGWLAKIEKAASDGTWQAAAWKLERRYPEQYGRQVVDHNHTHRLMLDELARIAEQEGWTDTQKADAVREAERILSGSGKA